MSILGLAVFCAGISMRAMDALLPRLSEEFGVSISDASQTVTFFTVSYGVALLLFGALGDRHGKLLVIAFGCIGCSASALACALSPDFFWLLIARLFSGIANSALMTLAMAWIGDVVPYRKRQLAISRLLIGMALGVTAGIFVGGLAADALVGWRSVFGLLAGCYLSVGLALLLLRRQLSDLASWEARPSDSLLRSCVDDYLRVFRLPWARTIFTIVCVEGAFYFGALAFIPYHLHVARGLSLSTAGSIVMLSGVGGLVFSLFSGVFIRGGEQRQIIAGAGIVASALAAIAIVPEWWIATPAAFCTGFGFYMLHSTLQTNATQLSLARRGAAMAAFSSLFFLGQAFGVSAFGQAIQRFDSTLPMLVAATGTLFIGLAFAWGLSRSRSLASQGGER